MESIVGVGFSIPSQENDYLEFNSNSSLSDADIVIFNPTYQLGYHTVEEKRHLGKEVIKSDYSFTTVEHTNHWKNEISAALKAGKIIFVILVKKTEFYIHTGESKTSGTGRTQKTSRIVAIHNNYEFLPSTELSIINSSGSKITLQSNLFTNLNNCAEKLFNFQAYVKSKKLIENQIFTTKNKDKIQGCYLNVDDGYLVFIPAIEFPKSFYTKADNHTKLAFQWGKQFKSCLFEISKALKKSTQNAPDPDWSKNNEYRLASSITVTEEIISLRSTAAQINTRILELEEVLHEHESLKHLLFESGKNLEIAVIKALKILGYAAENFDDGTLELDQIITSPEGDRFIGECEGKDKRDIDITKFRQLMDALSEDFARDEVQDKASGILFGNPQRLINPSIRILDFTDKCKRGAEREKIALIRTSDLYFAARHALESNDDNFKLLCRNSIKNQLGKIVKFPSTGI
jgi:hypothetical protein